jgi:riboflavin synthase
MFTGLIQDVGVIKGLRATADSMDYSIGTSIADKLRLGDSLAVNGVCLTVTDLQQGVAQATAVAETLKRTTLGALQAGVKVNLEPALALGEALGGHLVQGHVDGVGKLVSVGRNGVSSELTFEAPTELARYLVHKGSVAINGVSLTIARIERERFTVAVIPHTMDHTTLRLLRKGDRVNLEADVLAKYVEKLLGDRSTNEVAAKSQITESWLREKGF